MKQESEKSQKINRLNGTIWSMVVLGVMVIALIVFVMVSDRSNSVTAIALARTATYLQTQQAGTTTLINQAYPIATLPAEVNINGILIAGGLLVLVVFFTVIREAILHKRA
jgi:hypothetical protein